MFYFILIPSLSSLLPRQMMNNKNFEVKKLEKVVDKVENAEGEINRHYYFAAFEV